MPATHLAGFEERFAELKGVRIRYYVGGPSAGPAVALVHGLGGAATNWTLLGPELARTRRVLIPDLPGHGGSAPLPAAPSLEPFADRLGRLLERERMLPAALVGHSLGGLVSLRLARRRPGDVAGVVLAATAGIRSSTRYAERMLALFAFLEPGRRIVRFRDGIADSPFWRTLVFGYWGAADPRELPARAADALLDGQALHTDTDSARLALVRDDPRLDLGDVRSPCLVLWGAQDNQVPLEDAFEFTRRLGARLRVIAGCGHLLIVERPSECLDAVEEFLVSLPGLGLAVEEPK
jgi:pimeloyl-[acyl-carrier protein] methyl ester esterase